MGKASFHLILIALLGILAYSNSFDVPFQWDDKDYIVENPIIKDFSYFTDPSRAATPDINENTAKIMRKTRTVAFLTFLANYKMHGLEIRGYHTVNLAIHVANALIVYLLLVLTFQTPALATSVLRENSRNIALFSALFFVIHPLQTQAVTYICQRVTSLAAMLYLGSLVFYAKWRFALPSMRARRAAFYSLSLLLTVIAMKTKENAFTLPVAIAIYEFMFFAGEGRPEAGKVSFHAKRLLYLAPFLLTMLIIPATLIATDRPPGEAGGWEEAIGGATKTQELIPRRDYLFTQFRVIVTYLRLLVLPVNQNLDYDYPVHSSFLEPEVFLSFFFLALIVALGFHLLRRGNRLAAFGVFWFFLTLSVESSFISLEDVIFEHRLYLPSVGAFMALSSGALTLLGGIKNARARMVSISVLALIPLALLYATYARNTVWRSEVALWEDVANKSPKKARVFYNLGILYGQKGSADKAMKNYRIALRLMPDNPKTHNNLANIYQSVGLIDEAITHYNAALRLEPDFAAACNNLGNAYLSKGLIEEAITQYKAALNLDPAFAAAHYNLGRAYLESGLSEPARREIEAALSINPDFYQARQALGQIK